MKLNAARDGGTPGSRVQKRLRADEITELIAGYRAGVTILDPARRHGVDRTTVMKVVERSGEPRRYPALSSDDINEAVAMYAARMSLADVGAVFGVHASTVRLALVRMGIQMRDTHGRDRTSLDTVRSGDHWRLACIPERLRFGGTRTLIVQRASARFRECPRVSG